LAAAIKNHADCANNPAMRTNDVDCFLHASTAGHDIFDDDEFFIRRNLKTASQNKFAIFFFDKDVAFAQLATHFLTDNNSAKRRGDHRVAIKFAEFVSEPSTDFCRDVGVLKKYRALKILPAVQTGPQNEVALEQSPGFAEKGEQFFPHFGSAGMLPALSGMLPDSFKPVFVGGPPAKCRRRRAECPRSPRRKCFAIARSILS
jgi:hypothetical protein